MIATCELISVSREKYDKESNQILKKHLRILSSIVEKKLTKYITQVTIIKPVFDNKITYSDYYLNLEDSIEKIKKEGVDVVTLEVGPLKTSYSQFICAYSTYPNFDYYILMEDDWVPYSRLDFCFDEYLVLQMKYGEMCFNSSWVPKKFCGQSLHSAISVGIIDKKTLFRIKKFFTENITQMKFSDIIKRTGGKLRDYSDKGKRFMIPFWETTQGVIWEFSNFIHDRYLLVPIQFEEPDRYPRNQFYQVYPMKDKIVY